MGQKLDFDAEVGDRIVYVRAVATTELPAELRDKVGEIDHLYALHNLNGERLALVRDRAMAFILARQNDVTAVSVH